MNHFIKDTSNKGVLVFLDWELYSSAIPLGSLLVLASRLRSRIDKLVLLATVEMPANSAHKGCEYAVVSGHIFT